MIVSPPLRSLLLIAILLTALPLTARDYRITLPSASVDRAGQVIRFTLPSDAPATPSLLGPSSAETPLQLDADGSAFFLVPWQSAGTTLVFQLTSRRSDTEAGVKVAQVEGDLTLRLGQTDVIGYRMDREKLPRPGINPAHKRAGYLYPIYSPSGKNITDDYPEQHIHHHGIWSPWTKTRFQDRTPDFWNTGAKTGTADFVALDHTWEGPVSGGFRARHQMTDLSAPSPVVALNESWEVTLYNMPSTQTPVRVFDLSLVQTCATSDPLILPEYRYGGLGFRGPGEWLGTDRSFVLTSEGETDRVKAHTTRVSWIFHYGEVEGALAGIMLLGHPENFRAPQPVRVHPREPFICFAPSQLGEWKIEPGHPYRARYRFITMDGPPDPVLLEAYWQGYAHPATPELTAGSPKP